MSHNTPLPDDKAGILDMEMNVVVRAPYTPLGTLAIWCWRLAVWLGAQPDVETRAVGITRFRDLSQARKDEVVVDLLTDGGRYKTAQLNHEDSDEEA